MHLGFLRVIISLAFITCTPYPGARANNATEEKEILEVRKQSSQASATNVILVRSVGHMNRLGNASHLETEHLEYHGPASGAGADKWDPS
jgi:hypothetical protein